MAKQKGIIKLQGTIGDITFFKTADGYLAREHAPISAEQIANNPAFQRTRENNQEFGRAVKASVLLRKALRPMLAGTKTGRLQALLTRDFMRVIKADSANLRGNRNVMDGEAELLQGFDLNKKTSLGSTLYAPYQASINRVTGECLVALPTFVPEKFIVAPAGTTHFKLLAMATAVNFPANDYIVDSQETGMHTCDTVPVAAITMACTLPPATSDPIFLTLGIQFYQLLNGNYYTLKDAGFNALQLVKIDSK